jgi:hypothetical protein
MNPRITPPDPLIQLPDPDAIRAAIDATDERARLLRRLLRVSTRLGLHLAPASAQPDQGLKEHALLPQPAHP